MKESGTSFPIRGNPKVNVVPPSLMDYHMAVLRHKARKSNPRYGKMSRKFLLALFFGLILVMAMPGYRGEHEASHRYFVSGYAVQEGGGPACGLTVQAQDRTATTDHRGWYRIQLHMHLEGDAASGTESDVGSTILVRLVGTEISQTTTALPSSLEDGWGESSVDFQVPQGLSEACVSPAVQIALYVGIPLIAVAGLSVTYFKFIKPLWLSRQRAPALSSLPGIGKGRLQELKRMGIETLEDLAATDPSKISQTTSIGRKEAKRLVRRAREKLGENTSDG